VPSWGVRRIVLVASLAALMIPLGCSSSSHAVPTCAQVERVATPVTKSGSQKFTGSVVSVMAANAAFTPTCVTDVPRGTVNLEVRNTGESLHNVQIISQHIDEDVAPGHTVTVRVTVGTQPVVYVCKYHRTLGMVGVLIPAKGE
jgi:plastocyanin